MNIEHFIKMIYAILLCFMLSIGVVAFLFGYYIFKSYDNAGVSASQTVSSSSTVKQDIN